MKTILIILASTIQLSGQARTTHTIITPNIITNLDGTLKDESVYDCPDIETELLTLLEQYEQECYADSGFVDVYDGCGNPGCAVYHGYKKEIAHTKPTFTGFIEFLRRKK